MRRVFIAIAAAALVFALAASGAPPTPSAKATAESQIEHGKYLVENVGMCADCHSPRNEKGEYIKEEWLHGAPILFKVSIPMPFAETAPALAGLPGVDDDVAIDFLMGDREKLPARPPMPEYRLSREDAVAVVKYLKTLKAPPIKQAAETK